LLYRLCGHEGSIHRVTWGPATTLTSNSCSCSSSSINSSSSGADVSRTLLLGSCSDDRSARIWQVPLVSDAREQQQQQQQQLQQAPLHVPHQQQQQQLQQHCATDSSGVAAPAAESTPVVLDATATLWGHTARVWDLAFLGDQQAGPYTQAGTGAIATSVSSSSSSSSSSSRLLVATGSEDCSCFLWDVATGQQVAVLKVGLPSHKGAASLHALTHVQVTSSCCKAL
jgi:WD40 repeat protein